MPLCVKGGMAGLEGLAEVYVTRQELEDMVVLTRRKVKVQQEQREQLGLEAQQRVRERCEAYEEIRRRRKKVLREVRRVEGLAVINEKREAAVRNEFAATELRSYLRAATLESAANKTEQARDYQSLITAHRRSLSHLRNIGTICQREARLRQEVELESAESHRALRDQSCFAEKRLKSLLNAQVSRRQSALPPHLLLAAKKQIISDECLQRALVTKRQDIKAGLLLLRAVRTPPPALPKIKRKKREGKKKKKKEKK